MKKLTSKVTIALTLAFAGAALAAYGQFRNPQNALPMDGYPVVAQGPPPPVCPPHCSPPKTTRSYRSKHR